MNPRMPHLPAQSWDLFLRDELSAEATGRIEAHLADCTECSAALEREDPSFLFRRLRSEPAPAAALDDLWDAIRAEIGEIPSVPRPAPSRVARWSGLRSAVAIGGTAAAIILGILIVGRTPTHLPSAPPSQPPAQSQDVVAAVEPCPAALSASLRLTRAECAALYGDPVFSPEAPVMLVSDSLDLRGL